MIPLSVDFYKRDTIQVARELLGKLIVREIHGEQLIGMIVETEAYHAFDPACHAFKGKTERNESLFGPVGHAYVYFIYGNHYCLNVVSHDQNVIAGGVLIRAVEPLEGIEIMHQLRGQHTIKNLTNGPGKLAQAFAIDRKLDGTPLTGEGPITLCEGVPIASHRIQATQRIGISQATEHEWRFILKDSLYLSK